MNRKTIIAAALALAIGGSSLAFAQDSAHPAHEGPSVSIPADQIKFFATGVKAEKGELQAGPAYGDLQHGRHGTFIHMQ
ncbi:hypothetical protein ACKI1O_51420, partial [Streptomyces scabiei]